MATAGDGASSYQSGGAGGKFRKKHVRRSAQTTPYERHPTALRNNNPSLFAKLVDPASRLIYAGADRLFGVFRKRLPSIAAPRPPEIREEPKPSTDEDGNLASISATTELSELESMLKQKTFTRSEIEHLTALLHAKTANSDSDEGDRAKNFSPSSHFLRLEEASTSKHVEEREKENIHHATAISTPVVASRVFEEDVASPAELARAYMGARTPKVSPPTTLRFGTQPPRHDSVLLNTTTILPKTPITSLTPRTTIGTFKGGYENGLTTPRSSRGRSAIYNMARTPYSRPPSTFSQKVINSPTLPLSYPASLEQERSIESSKMGYKRRSYMVDDIGSGGPVRRIRQKANLLSSQGSPLVLNNTKSEFSQKLLLRNEPHDSKKSFEEKGETSLGSNLGYGSVPTKSTQTATKILEQLERFSPKEKSPVSRLSQTSEKVDLASSPKLMLLDNNNNKKGESLVVIDTPPRESTSQSSKGKEKVEENGPTRKFAVPRNVLNGNAGVTIRDNGPAVAVKTDSMFKMPVAVEPLQKKRFQMSAPEDVEVDDDDRRSNGHVFGQIKKPETTSVFAANKDVVSAEVNNNKVSPTPQVEKVGEREKNDVPVQKKVTFNLSQQPSAAVVPQKITTETVATTTKNANAEIVPSPFLFSASNQSAGFKPNTTSPDAKPLVPSTSLFNAVDEVQSKKEENGNAVNVSESLPKNTTSFSTTNGGGAPSTTFASSFPFPSFNTTTTTTTNKIFGGAASLPSTTTTSSPSGGTVPTPATTSLFASTSFGFSSPAPPTSTTVNNSQASPLFNTTTTTSGLQKASFGGTGTTPNPFGSSTAPSFGLLGSSFAVATSEIKSLTTSTPPPSFGLTNSAWQPPPPTSTTTPPTTTPAFTFGGSSAAATTTSSSPAVVFGSSSPIFSFTAAAPSQSQSQPIFGSTASPQNNNNNNNDQMSMEDTMAEDSTPTPSPSVPPAFGGQPSSSGGFMFGSATPTPPSTGVPFHFGGGGQSQTNQPPSPFLTSSGGFQTPSQNNPFQASGSLEFGAGGSFSLGSGGGGGGDKSGRRFVKVRGTIKNRKK